MAASDKVKGGAWSSLNSDVLESISKRLRLVDYIRMKAVCKSWRLVLIQDRPFRHDPHNQLPWLAVPDDSSDICKFYDLTENKFRHIYLPELRDRICCGTSYGWMVVLDDQTQDPFLLNPLTRSRIQLPPVTTFPELPRFLHLPRDNYGRTIALDLESARLPPADSYKGRLFIKAILSANPSVTGDYIDMAIYGPYRRLVFCRPGDKEWTSVDDTRCLYNDIVYWKQRVYAVIVSSLLVVCDLGGSVPKVKSIVHTYCGPFRSYLVISKDDELLLVVRKRSGERYRSFWGDESNSRNNRFRVTVDKNVVFEPLFEKTDGFRLFQFDEERLDWVRITNLEDRVLFVGNNFGLSFSVDTFPNCKANHIYFTDDYLDPGYAYLKDEAKTLVGHDLGCFDLTTDKSEPLPCFLNAASTRTIWPVPFMCWLSSRFDHRFSCLLGKEEKYWVHPKREVHTHSTHKLH